MTETGMSLGTPYYMSPEQAMGERDITARSDVYALGCVTYEMLLGEPPFTGPTAQAILAKVMTAAPASLTQQRRHIPPHVEDAVVAALEKLPADRPASAAEFAQALAGSTSGPRYDAARARGTAPAFPPYRRPALTGWGVAVLALGVAAWALLRQPRPAGPSVFDAVLPDSAPMTFGAVTGNTSYGVSARNLSVSPAGDFAVYAARQGDSTFLWYRSLRDATARPIIGTRGGTAPRISPDGSRVAFLVGDRVMVAPVAGGESRRLLEGQSAMSLQWTSETEVLAVDLDGYRLKRLDREGGGAQTRTIARCALGQWIPEFKQLLCSYNRTAMLFDPESGKRWTLRAALPDGSPGGLLAGSAFRVVDGHYLVYLAVDGSLLAARYDPATHLAQRSVTLLTGVRREAVGEAQYDLAANGTLLYAPGVDATVGRMVSLHPGGPPQPLPVETADFQRYDLSRDRRWLAAAVQAAEGTELRIYDLRDGQHFTWLKGESVRHPLWNPDGEHLLLALRDSTRWTILRGAPSLGAPPDTVAGFEFDPTNPDPVDYHDDHTAVSMDWAGSVVMRFDPGASRPKLDTVLTGARFPAVSPNGRLIVYQTMESGRILVTSFPKAGRQWQLASQGVEPMWLSPGEVLYRLGVSWYLARVNPETGEPVGAPTFWGRDARFSDTSGWSNRPSHDGGIIYVQGPEQTSTTYLRVMPDWVAGMKRAVDAANR
jgi:serine/threonine-protein kinase